MTIDELGFVFGFTWFLQYGWKQLVVVLLFLQIWRIERPITTNGDVIYLSILPLPTNNAHSSVQLQIIIISLCTYVHSLLTPPNRPIQPQLLKDRDHQNQIIHFLH